MGVDYGLLSVPSKVRVRLDQALVSLHPSGTSDEPERSTSDTHVMDAPTYDVLLEAVADVCHFQYSKMKALWAVFDVIHS